MGNETQNAGHRWTAVDRYAKFKDYLSQAADDKLNKDKSTGKKRRGRREEVEEKRWDKEMKAAIEEETSASHTQKM